jgi:hypothetical protein
MQVREEFELRKSEIENYFIFLKEIEEDKWIGLINPELSKVMKANGFLLLYNLIESYVYYSIIEIFSEVKYNEVKYKEAIDEVKTFWLKTKFKNQDEKTNLSTIQKFKNYIEEIIEEKIMELEIERIDYGGSLTPQKIREISNNLGVCFSESNYKDYPNGKALTDIKEKRNHLVHGKFSFGQIGKDLTYKGEVKQIGDDEPKIQKFGLNHYKFFSFQYLDEFINSVETYIQNQSYKS